MPSPIKVTLAPAADPKYLEVSGTGNIIFKDPYKQDITWRLIGNAAGGAFVDFWWVTPPPAGIFGNPTYPSAGTLVITDLNKNLSSTGEWVYGLKAKVGTKTYSTIATLGKTAQAKSTILMLTNSDPTIKNR
jgi:hypothetical protein